ncbi:hypothetical protein IID24_02745 [Patescibacteria group bacterium]|nr:hypothetical protein [Patescibacteria group bacterium]
METEIKADKLRILRKCQTDPRYFCDLNLNIEHWWDGMDRMCEAIANNRKVIVPSGHALSKDYTAGALALWFLYSFYPSKVVFTAPSIRQVSDVMWAEITSKHDAKKAPLEGYRKHLYIKISDQHFLTGFTTKEVKGQTGKFQGYHGPNVLMIFSEAQAIDDVIFEEADGCLTAENNKIILLGNPLRATGYFARAMDDPTWHKVQLSCLDSPNVLAGKEIIPGMVSKMWVDEKRKQWQAVGDPRWESRVLGQKPKITIDNVIPMEYVTRCINKKPYCNMEIRLTSGDYARFGDDATVIYNWKNRIPIKKDKMAMSSGPECSSHSVIMSQENESTLLLGDADGLGGPVMDFNRKALAHNNKIRLIDIHGNGEPEDKLQFANLRAEMWWYCREQLRQEMFCVPDDPMLIEDLTDILYFYNSKGKIQIESKKDIKERRGLSPNEGDSYVIGCWGHKEEIQSRPDDQPYRDPYAYQDSETESEESFMSA